MVEIVGLASGPLVVALNLLQLVLMAAIVVIALLMARRGNTWVGYVLALGILSLAAHNVLEIFTEVEELSVALFKTIATVLILVAVWFFATHEKERIKIMGYTERLEKDVEERTREVKKLADISDSSIDAIVGLGLDGRMEFWNRGAERMFGYTREDMLGRNFMEMLPEELAEAEKTCFAEVVEKGFIENHESVRIHKDGRWIPVLITATALKDAEGNLSGISAVMKDLTEIKKLQSAVIGEKTRLESLIRGVKEGVTFADANDNVVLLNTSAEKLLGVKSSDVIGKPILSCHRDRMEKVSEVLRAFKEGKLEYHASEVSYDGKHFEVTASPIKNDSEYLGTVMILRDITERKRAERAIKKYAAQLEEANRLKDLFTDIMRHDLLNPVTVIKGVSQILRQENSGKTQEGLERIMNSAGKLEVMIESASKYAKLEDAEELDFQELDLNEVLKEVISSFKPLLDEKKMKLEYKAMGKKPVMGNPVIEDVFANLMANAIKYSPGGSEIVIEVEDMDKDWRIAVKDRGKGVADEYKKAVFERFERGGKQGVKGTGLGLAIVKRIVELHKGRVWVEDNPKGGSIFYVEIPKKRDKPT